MRREEGTGAYGTGPELKCCDGCSECDVVSSTGTLAEEPLSSEFAKEPTIGGVYGRGVCRIGCTY